MSYKTLSECADSQLCESSDNVQIIQIKIGKRKVQFEVMLNYSNWNVTDTENKGIVMSGYYYDGKIGVENTDKSINYFEDELKDSVFKIIKKLSK